MVRAVLVVLAVWVLFKGVVFLVPRWRRRLLGVWLESAAVVRLAGVLCALLAALLWCLLGDAHGAARVTLIVLAVWCLTGALLFLLCPYSWTVAVCAWAEDAMGRKRWPAWVGMAMISQAVAGWLLWVSFAA